MNPRSTRRYAACLLAAIAVLLHAAAAALAERTLLLVDDHHVLYRAGTGRVLHRPLRHAANPLITEDKPWEMLIGWTSVWRDPESGKYQLWYQAYAGGRDGRDTHKSLVCYAESTDGIRFTKPNLGLFDFKGDKNTNIVLIGTGAYGHRYCNSVVVEPTDPDPAKRYKMMYYDFAEDDQGQLWPAWLAAFSPDGIHWTKAPQGPRVLTAFGSRGVQPPLAGEPVYVERMENKGLRRTWHLPLSMSDAVDVFRDPVRNVYAAYAKSWIQGPDGATGWKHAMARVESTDFIQWSRPQVLAYPDEFDAPNTEFHTTPVFHHAGLYFCLNQLLLARGETVGARSDLFEIELMISRDGLRWERPFRTPDQRWMVGDASEPFSTGMLLTNCSPVMLRDEMRFYYAGYPSGLPKPPKGTVLNTGIGVATLPRDRFAGLRTLPQSAQPTLRRPLEHVGQVTLKPVSLAGVTQITVNADARDGEIRLELLDADGFRVPGFTREESATMRGDDLAHHANWNAQRLADLPPGEYHLRIHLHRAEVFAVTFR